VRRRISSARVLVQLEDLRGFEGLVAFFVLFSACGEEICDVHDGALDARRA